MKRGKDNSFSEKGGPPGYVPLTLHQLGIGLTYYDEQRPAPQRNRNDNRRGHEGNSRHGHQIDPGNEALVGSGEDHSDDSPLDEVGPDDGMTQEAALDQLQSGRSHNGGGRRHQNGGGGRRQRHSNGGNGGRRHGSSGNGSNHGGSNHGGSNHGPMRGGIAGGGRQRRGNNSGGEGHHAEFSRADSPRSEQSRDADWAGGDSEE